MPIVLLTLLGAVLRFVCIGHQGFWYDESYTVELLRYSPGRMLGQLPHVESTPPLYYCVAWLWARIFGFGPAGLKLAVGRMRHSNDPDRVSGYRQAARRAGAPH